MSDQEPSPNRAGRVRFVTTARDVAVLHINFDGRLMNYGQRLPLPDKTKQPGSPAVLMHEPHSRRLFLGMNCDSTERCEENTYLSVYSFRVNSYSHPSMIYSSFDHNASYHQMVTALSQSRGKKPMVVMGLVCRAIQTVTLQYLQ